MIFLITGCISDDDDDDDDEVVTTNGRGGTVSESACINNGLRKKEKGQRVSREEKATSADTHTHTHTHTHTPQVA